ncbi:MAG: hypothetical protein SWE60_03490 [Thermodesulfobacteriota bacterium]|nr:hypothetical protein [Thermodesulfobacteriota bacterium]
MSISFSENVLTSCTKYVDRLKRHKDFYEDRWNERQQSCGSCMVIIPAPNHLSADLPYRLETLVLLYDNLLWVRPPSEILIPDENDASGQVLANKIATLCKEGCIHTLNADYGPPLESWAELESLRAQFCTDFASYSAQAFLDSRRKPHNEQEEHELEFCKLFNELYKHELNRDKRFRAAFDQVYAKDAYYAFKSPADWGLFDLRRIAQTRYILSGVGDVRSFSGRSILEDTADAILSRIVRVTSLLSDENAEALKDPIGKHEFFVTSASGVLSVPRSIDAEGLSQLRVTPEATRLRQTLSCSMGESNCQELPEALDDFRRIIARGSILVDISITSLMTTIGFLVGDLPGALIGNVGAIPLKQLAEPMLLQLKKAKLRWLTDRSRERP